MLGESLCTYIILLKYFMKTEIFNFEIFQLNNLKFEISNSESLNLTENLLIKGA